MIRLRWICGALVWLALTVSAWPALADSLFAPEAVEAGDTGLYSKHPVVLEVGDIVKVRVREKTTADVELGLETKDESKQSVKAQSNGNLLRKLLGPVLDAIGVGDISYQNSGEFKDDGKTDRSVRLDAIVTALVVEKMENGYLIIEGRKQVKVNKEHQTMVVRGVIDPADLDADLIIDSDYVADVEIEYVGEGQLSKKTKPGFLSRVIDFIF